MKELVHFIAEYLRFLEASHEDERVAHMLKYIMICRPDLLRFILEEEEALKDVV